MKPWREVARPHKDVLEGTFQQSDFAADISRVANGTATMLAEARHTRCLRSIILRRMQGRLDFGKFLMKYWQICQARE